MAKTNPIRVLVVDDSAIVRKVLTETLDAEPDIKVIASAPDPFVARDKIVALKPDVLTLDIEMPRMDGLTFLDKLMRYHPMPVIVVSSIGNASCEMAMEALRRGAVEVLGKPAGPYSVGELRLVLAMKIRAAARARLRSRSATVPAAGSAPPPSGAQAFREGTIVAIGASTGGTEALEVVLRQFPKDAPGTVVVQHIPAGFSRAFANRLAHICQVEIKEAVHGDYLVPGRVLVAPGDFHMVLRRVDGTYRVSVKSGPRVCYQRPSVDILFQSVAATSGAKAVGVILTGMGSDGAKGMLEMKRAGAYNIAQDEATSVVFGMPREAIRAGAIDTVVPLETVASTILGHVAQAPSSLARTG